MFRLAWDGHLLAFLVMYSSYENLSFKRKKIAKHD